MSNPTTYYYADIDKNGVLCVDRVYGYEDDPYADEPIVVNLAERNPSTIYFAIEPAPALHAHVSSESSDCDGRYSRTYVIDQTDEELNGSPFDGYDGEEAFRLRVLQYIGSTTPEYGGRLSIAPGGDEYTWAEQTDEGYRHVEATFCREDDADEKSTQRDHSAEASGY
jgi:hypothetical protein